MADLVGGQISASFASMPSAIPFIKSGKLRALGVSASKRSSALPETPTVAEAGVPGFSVLDWQGLLVSTGLQDVAYLLTQNLDPELRRKNERELVKHYHSELVKNGVKGYSYEQCWNDYRTAALYLFVYALVISGTLDPSTDRGRAFMSALMTRAVRTVEELGLFAMLDDPSAGQLPVKKSLLRRILGR